MTEHEGENGMRKKQWISGLAALCVLLLAGCGAKAPEEPVSTPPAAEISPAIAEESAKPNETQPVSSPEGTALRIHGTDYSVEQVSVCFADQYYSFVSDYGDIAIYYGLDTSRGITDLADQECSFSEDGTWYGYFLESAVESLLQIQALCDYAKQNGIALTEEERAEIDLWMKEIDAGAREAGMDGVEGYLADYYGSGVTVDLFRSYMENMSLADRAYNSFASSLSYTDEDIAAYIAEMGYDTDEYDYPVTSMRHVLIMAAEDEKGEYSEEAIAAAHEKAELLYEEWSAGDRSEESFAALAEAYSDDGGSCQNGGLYENIYKEQMVDGINEWLFHPDRAVGDTAVIDNNGHYVGTHIVYFTGYGDLYGHILALEDMQYNTMLDWFGALTADYSPEPGPDYASIGIYSR